MSGPLRLTGELAEIAKKLLYQTCNLLDTYKIPYTLEGGTLLGIVRENRLLPWDNDLDLTITENQMKRVLKLKWKFWLAGYRIYLRKSKYDMPYFPKGSVRLLKLKTGRFFKKNSIGLMDIFVKKKIDDQYYWLVGQHEHVLKSVPAHFYENLSRYNFEGYNYSIPRDYDEYLTFRYGDWRTPFKDYNFKVDDKSIVPATPAPVNGGREIIPDKNR